MRDMSPGFEFDNYTFVELFAPPLDSLFLMLDQRYVGHAHFVFTM